MVKKDHTVFFDGLVLQIPFCKKYPCTADRQVEVRQYRDGHLEIGYRGSIVARFSWDSYCMCSECSGETGKCKGPGTARPSPESRAADVFSTVKKCGVPIEPLTTYAQAMNRYAFLMVALVLSLEPLYLLWFSGSELRISNSCESTSTTPATHFLLDNNKIVKYSYVHIMHM
jgi:hypothetical protein